MENIGEIISLLRKEHNISQQKLGLLIGYDANFISKIERGKSKLPQNLLLPLSKALKFDFVTFSQYEDNYKTFEHFLAASKLQATIDNMDAIQMEIELRNPIIQNEFTYGTPLILKKYCIALVKTVTYKDLQTSNNLCMEILNIESLSDITYFKPTLYSEDRYYSTILLLGVNLYNLNKHTLHKNLLQNTLVTLEESIFNDEISISLTSYFFKKYYINLLNNYADVLYTLKEYKIALDICNKAINFGVKYNNSYMINFLLRLKIEILFKLGDLELANHTFSNFKSVCDITNNLTYFEKVIIDFKSNNMNLDY